MTALQQVNKPATDIPEGYWRDSRGALIPVNMIKDIDRQRDETVREIVAAAKHLNQLLSKFKGQTYGDIEAFVDLSMQQYGTQWGGKKGNITLTSFDGKYKVLRSYSDNLIFDERIQAAKELIDECGQDWVEGASPEAKVILENAFQVDKTGKISVRRVLELRRLNFKDPRWLRAMDAINDSLQVIGSTSYIRVYERVDDSERYKQISLDLAAVRL